jgi:SOS response regulatory protein OraA/RecX
MTLDRETLRSIRRELRRGEALEVAGRALARRDLSRARVLERLERARVAPAEKRQAVETLEALGLVDDASGARSRAHDLATRGWGDAAIGARLGEEGFPNEAVAAALGELESERIRAAALAAPGRDRRTTARLLARRGFGEDAIEAAVGPLDELAPARVP